MVRLLTWEGGRIPVGTKASRSDAFMSMPDPSTSMSTSWGLASARTRAAEKARKRSPYMVYIGCLLARNDMLYSLLELLIFSRSINVEIKHGKREHPQTHTHTHAQRETERKGKED